MMNHTHQQQQQQQLNQPSVGYQPPSTAAGPYVVAPPAGYPMRQGDDQPYYSQKPVAFETKSRGDDFWKGCAAALCCCCLLDACF